MPPSTSPSFHPSNWRTSRKRREFSNLVKRCMERGWLVLCPACERPKRPGKRCDECYIANETWGYMDALEHQNKWVRSLYLDNPPPQTIHYGHEGWCHLHALCGIPCGLQPRDPIPVSDDILVTCSRCNAARAARLIDILAAEREHTREWFAPVIWMGSLAGFISARPDGLRPRFTRHHDADPTTTSLSYAYPRPDPDDYDLQPIAERDADTITSICAASKTLKAARRAVHRHFRVQAFEQPPARQPFQQRNGPRT